MRTSLARGLMAIRGYTQEVADIYADALVQLEETGEPSDAVPLLRSLGSLYLYRGEFAKGISIGERLLELAGHEEPALQAEGHLRIGTNLVSLGRVDEGLDHLDRAIGLFDPQQHGSGRLRLGASPGVVPYTTSAFVLWSIGHPARAIERGAGALRIAAELRHPYSAAYALFHVAFLDVWRRDWASVHDRASQVLGIAEEHDYQVWRALALIFLGVSETALGHHAEGMALSDQGIARYQDLTTPPVFWPMLLSVRARGFGMAGRPEEGLEPVDQAIELMEGLDNVLFPQLPLVKGDLLAATTVRRTLEARSATRSIRPMRPGPACGNSAPPPGSQSCARPRVSRRGRSAPPFTRYSKPSRMSPTRRTSSMRASSSRGRTHNPPLTVGNTSLAA